MAEAVMNDDLRPLAALLREEQEKRRRAEMQRILEAVRAYFALTKAEPDYTPSTFQAALSADPLDPSAQAKIEEAVPLLTPPPPLSLVLPTHPLVDSNGEREREYGDSYRIQS